MKKDKEFLVMALLIGGFFVLFFLVGTANLRSTRIDFTKHMGKYRINQCHPLEIGEQAQFSSYQRDAFLDLCNPELEEKIDQILLQSPSPNFNKKYILIRFSSNKNLKGKEPVEVLEKILQPCVSLMTNRRGYPFWEWKIVAN